MASLLRRFALAAYLPLALALAAGCKGREPRPRLTVPGDAEGLWTYAKVTREPAEVPARYAAALPTTLAEMERFLAGDEAFPPPGHVGAALGLLDEEMLARLDAALAQAPAAERAELIDRWEASSSLGGLGREEVFCPAARTIVAGPHRPAAEVLLAWMAITCARLEDRALYERAGVPPDVTLEYAEVLSWNGDPASVAAAKEICARAGGEPVECARLGEEPLEPDEPPTPLIAQLRREGRFVSFDAETGTFPNGHDEQLRVLASMCRPALDAAVFAEVPPPEDAGEGEAGYLLEAWVAGEHVTTPAANYGDWYDTVSMVGLLNTSLRIARSDCRILELEAMDQIALFAGGPASAVHDAVVSGALTPSRSP